MAKKIDILEEMKGQARVFRIDRDTLIIYTGRDKSDLYPFIRIGSGEEIPHGILQHIENVVLPEAGLWNLGLEMSWQNATLAQGHDYIRYVGSKERVSQVYNYTRISDKEEEEHKEKVKMLPYGRPDMTSNPKVKSFITFFNGGNLNVQVNGQKALDLTTFQRARIGLDKQYELIEKVQKKLPLRVNEGMSFVYLGTEDGIVPSMFWNFEGRRMFMNPLSEFSEVLFENMIDARSPDIIISNNPYRPGFVEAMRRTSITEGNLGIYCPFPEQMLQLKKLYDKGRFTFFDDSRALPTYKNATFYVSRSGSHGLFSCKMSDNAESNVQILYPLGLGKKVSKVFDYTKGPYDVEFVSAETKDEIEGLKDARLKLHFPGGMEIKKYLKTKIKTGVLPLLEGAEYKFFYTEDSHTIGNLLTASLEGTGYDEPIRALISAAHGQKIDDKALRGILLELRKLPVPVNISERLNLYEAVRYLKNTSGFSDFRPMIQKGIDRIQKRSKYSSLKIQDLYGLSGNLTEVEILFDRGLQSYAVHRTVNRYHPFDLHFPPAVGDLEVFGDEYKSLLKQQNKIMDKMDVDHPGFRQSVEMMEKLFEDRRLMYTERERLSLLLQELGMTFEVQEESVSTLPSYIPPRMRDFIESLNIQEKWNKFMHLFNPVVEQIRDLRAVFFIVPLFFLFGAAVFFGFRHISFSGSSSGTAAATGGEKGFFDSWFGSKEVKSHSGSSIAGITEDGSSEAEKNAVFPVDPGSMQADAVVPGENDVTYVASEIKQYANSLASKNGFAELHNRLEGDLRDPNLVFPGDRLYLPDGRIVKIERGQTIWQVSTRHYKKDYARIKILERQILSSDDAKKKRLQLS